MKSKQSKQETCSIRECDTSEINESGSLPVYRILLLNGQGVVKIDLTAYDFNGKVAIFTTPYQTIQFKVKKAIKVRSLGFHGDFYCIEDHKKEVACNGVLFNNIYHKPFIHLEENVNTELNDLFSKLNETDQPDVHSMAIVRAYLQLILAICNKIKSGLMTNLAPTLIYHPVMEFIGLLEENFHEHRQPAYYAHQIGLAPNTFSKKCKALLLKSPSTLIHDRTILEAKKLIHLSYKSMKEIAAILNFDDENYFSRYFKKHTGVSPSTFREKVGISIVADLSR